MSSVWNALFFSLSVSWENRSTNKWLQETLHRIFRINQVIINGGHFLNNWDYEGFRRWGVGLGRRPGPPDRRRVNFYIQHVAWGSLWFHAFCSINSNWFSLSIFSPLMDERLTAYWYIFSFFPISMVVMPNFRWAQKHKRLRALTIWGDFPKAVTWSISMYYVELHIKKVVWDKRPCKTIGLCFRNQIIETI